MHASDGVVANGPGPLDLAYRCALEEEGGIGASETCGLLFDAYGSAAVNPDDYFARSLLNFTSGHTSAIMFVQGMMDADIQLHSWPTFRGHGKL